MSGPTVKPQGSSIKALKTQHKPQDSSRSTNKYKLHPRKPMNLNK